jgi:hypothetical protein
MDEQHIKKSENCYVFKNGVIYTGNLDINNRFEGFGVYIDKKNNKFVGQWKDGEFIEGYGVYKYCDGDLYDGQWKDDQQHGQGIMMYKNGNEYNGEWFNNERNGYGKLVYINGDIYDGNWVDDACNGYGKKILKNGNIIEGEWKDNSPWNCKIIYTNGDEYEFIYKNGEIDDNVKIIYKNGNIYEGKIKDNKRNGEGKMTLLNGNVFDGEWAGDLFAGKVRVLCQNNNIFEKAYEKTNICDIDDKVINGFCRIICQNGNIIECEIKNKCISNILNAKIIFNDKSICKCSIINNITNGAGIIEYPDDSIYEGDIYDNKPNGFGKLIFSSGIAKIGMWNNGKLTNEDITMPQCKICLHYKDSSKFYSYCEHCNKRICTSCYEYNFRDIKDVRILTKNKFCCPFCRNVPFYLGLEDKIIDLIKKYDKCIKCSVCDKYENITEECGENNSNIDIDKFRCNECVLWNGVKNCPNCGIHIQKINGCNHISCRCGHHFCWNCNQNWNNVLVGNREYHYNSSCK